MIRHIRPRCVCINCEKVVQAYPASKPIAKGMAGPGLLAHILVQKYCNHLPLYRQSEIYAREDIELSRSTPRTNSKVKYKKTKKYLFHKNLCYLNLLPIILPSKLYFKIRNIFTTVTQD